MLLLTPNFIEQLPEAQKSPARNTAGLHSERHPQAGLCLPRKVECGVGGMINGEVAWGATLVVMGVPFHTLVGAGGAMAF